MHNTPTLAHADAALLRSTAARPRPPPSSVASSENHDGDALQCAGGSRQERGSGEQMQSHHRQSSSHVTHTNARFASASHLGPSAAAAAAGLSGRGSTAASLTAHAPHSTAPGCAPGTGGQPSGIGARAGGNTGGAPTAPGAATTNAATDHGGHRHSLDSRTPAATTQPRVTVAHKAASACGGAPGCKQLSAHPAHSGPVDGAVDVLPHEQLSPLEAARLKLPHRVANPAASTLQVRLFVFVCVCARARACVVCACVLP